MPEIARETHQFDILLATQSDVTSPLLSHNRVASPIRILRRREERTHCQLATVALLPDLGLSRILGGISKIGNRGRDSSFLWKTQL